MTLRSYLMATFYDRVLKGMEASCLFTWRSQLLASIHGDVLEIGSGTGLNLPHYPSSLNSLVLTEPDPHMRMRLTQKIDRNSTLRVSSADATHLDFADNSFDAIVSTLVLCSVPSPSKTLNEIKRILKPTGQLYFIEHVLATQAPHLIKWQRSVEPVWKYMCGNCHLTRDTQALIGEAGFQFVRLETPHAPGAPALISQVIMGIACKC